MSEDQDPSRLSREAFLEEQLEELLGDVDNARAHSKFTALAQLHRLALTTRKELDDERALKGDKGKPEDMDEDEYLRRLEEAARGWPDQHLEVILKVYQERHNLPALAVLDGGRT